MWWPGFSNRSLSRIRRVETGPPASIDRPEIFVQASGKEMTYKIEYSSDFGHLEALTARQQSLILDSEETQLQHEPIRETRNRKPMRPNPLAPWKLRIVSRLAGRSFIFEDTRIGRRNEIVAGLCSRDRCGDGRRYKARQTVTALVSLENVDRETLSLSANRALLELILGSREEHKSKGGISSEEMRRRFE